MMGINLRLLSTHFEILNNTTNKKDLVKNYEYIKDATNSKDLSELVTHIGKELQQDRDNSLPLKQLTQLENGLRLLGYHHKTVSHSEKNLLTRLFLWIFPKSERAIKTLEQDKSTLQQSKFLLHVVEGKEEKQRLELLTLDTRLGAKKDPRKAFISSLINDATFKDNAGSAMKNLINSQVDKKQSLKDLHNTMLKWFKKHGGEKIPELDLSDIYTAAIIASEEYLKNAEMGRLVELAYSPMDLNPLSEENYALTQLHLVFATIDEEDTHPIMDNAKLLSSYLFAPKPLHLKRMLQKADYAIREVKNPDKHDTLIKELIKDPEFQNASRQIISDFMDANRPIEVRFQKFTEAMNLQVEKYLKPKEGEDALRSEDRLEYNLDFYLAMWMAARHKIDNKTLFGMQNLLIMHLNIEPTGKEANTQATIATSLEFIQEISRPEWLERKNSA
jgi:hypothetical protein